MFGAENPRLRCWLLQKILGYFQSHFFFKGNVRKKGWHGRCWEVARDLESASASAASFLYEPHWVIPFSVSLREIRADAVVGSKILRRHCLQVSFHRSGPSRCGWWERGNRQASNPVRLRVHSSCKLWTQPSMERWLGLLQPLRMPDFPFHQSGGQVSDWPFIWMP